MSAESRSPLQGRASTASSSSVSAATLTHSKTTNMWTNLWRCCRSCHGDNHRGKISMGKIPSYHKDRLPSSCQGWLQVENHDQISLLGSSTSHRVPGAEGKWWRVPTLLHWAPMACSSYPAPPPWEEHQGWQLRCCQAHPWKWQRPTHGKGISWTMTKRHESYLASIFTVILVEFISEQEPGCMPLWSEDGTKRCASVHHVGTGKGERVTLLHRYQKIQSLV